MRRYAREAPFCWSAQGGGTDPWETGSYDLALEEAHIEDFNIGGSCSDDLLHPPSFCASESLHAD